LLSVPRFTFLCHFQPERNFEILLGTQRRSGAFWPTPNTGSSYTNTFKCASNDLDYRRYLYWRKPYCLNCKLLLLRYWSFSTFNDIIYEGCYFSRHYYIAIGNACWDNNLFIVVQGVYFKHMPSQINRLQLIWTDFPYSDIYNL